MSVSIVEQIDRLTEKVKNYMDWDDQKVVTWFRTENVLLGGVSPVALIAIGRADKLEKFIDGCIEENQTPQAGLTDGKGF